MPTTFGQLIGGEPLGLAVEYPLKKTGFGKIVVLVGENKTNAKFYMRFNNGSYKLLPPNVRTQTPRFPYKFPYYANNKAKIGIYEIYQIDKTGKSQPIKFQIAPKISGVKSQVFDANDNLNTDVQTVKQTDANTIATSMNKNILIIAGIAFILYSLKK